MKEFKKIVMTIVISLIMIHAAQAAILHVPGNSPPIRQEIAAAVNGDTVLVAAGTDTGNQNKNLYLNGKAITVMSQNGNAENCVIDCESDGRGFNLDHDESANTIITGFTIQNGTAMYGGGALCASSAVIKDCIFRNNVAENNGGAIFYNGHNKKSEIEKLYSVR